MGRDSKKYFTKNGKFKNINKFNFKDYTIVNLLKKHGINENEAIEI